MAVFRIAGQRVALDPETVERRLAGVLPEPVRDHYVVVQGRRYPPKQIVSVLTGLDRADFTTHQARRVLKRLGFVAARKRHAAREPVANGDPPLPRGGRQAAALEPYAGQWVALGEPEEVLVAAPSARAVVAWLSRHEQRASGIFRVPCSGCEAQGLAPR
jgi:hypothetical protein